MKAIHCGGKTYQTLRGAGFKVNYFETERKDEFWISGCKKDGADRNYGERVPINIDEDIQEEYWTDIRDMPSMVGTLVINGK